MCTEVLITPVPGHILCREEDRDIAVEESDSLEIDRNRSKMKFNSTKYKVSRSGTDNTNTLL